METVEVVQVVVALVASFLLGFRATTNAVRSTESFLCRVSQGWAFVIALVVMIPALWLVSEVVSIPAAYATAFGWSMGWGVVLVRWYQSAEPVRR